MDLLSSGIGGAVGAIAAATLAALKLKTAFNAFSETFHGYFAGRTDPASQEVIDSFDDLNADISSLSSAIERLKRAFRRR